MAEWALDYITDDYSSHPTLLDTMPSPLTIEAWIYVEGGEGTNRGIVGKDNIAGADRVRFWINTDNRIEFFAEGGNLGVKYATGGILSLNTWYYVVGIYQAGQPLKVYLNAVETTGDTADTIGNGTYGNFIIGNESHATLFRTPFNGIIDEVRLSNKVRSQAEIDAIWNSGNGVAFEVDGDTIALWHKNEGTSSTIYDETANNYDCTITGASWVAGYLFAVSILVTPPTLALTLSTFAPTIEITQNVKVTPATLALSLTTYAPTVILVGLENKLANMAAKLIGAGVI